MDADSTDVAIVGAGPNGLSLAAHLRRRGIAFRIFGTPMQTWRNIPRSISLKSLGFATSIPSPEPGHTFPEYCRARGLEDYEPIEIATFTEYGLDFQRRFVPEVEDARVTDLQRVDGNFALTLDTGERVLARRVVVAVGLTYFARTPEVLAGLPPDRLAHTWGPNDFQTYADQDVIVIGGGSSALETAVVLHEHGARVRVLARRTVAWGGRGKRTSEQTLRERIEVPVTAIGPGQKNWVLEHIPWLIHHVPASKRLRFTRTHLGPMPAWWLRERADGKFPIEEHVEVTDARFAGDKVHLRLRHANRSESELSVDRIIAGTGYEVDLDRMPFLSPDLIGQIRRWAGGPRLSRNFESSVPGLYFLGPVAAESFGPLVRFVAGASFAIPTVARHLDDRWKVPALITGLLARTSPRLRGTRATDS